MDYPDDYDPDPERTAYEQTPEFAAYEREMEAQEQRAIERRRATPPNSWGDRLSDTHYFCLPCWKSGIEDGSHPDSLPPCDPISRESRWA